MVLNTLDVSGLRLVVQAKEREEARKHNVTVTNVLGHGAAFLGEGKGAIFLVAQVTPIGKFLHHAGDRWLADIEGLRDIGHVGRALGLDQLMDALKIILSTLAHFARHSSKSMSVPDDEARSVVISE